MAVFLQARFWTKSVSMTYVRPAVVVRQRVNIYLLSSITYHRPKEVVAASVKLQPKKENGRTSGVLVGQKGGAFEGVF